MAEPVRVTRPLLAVLEVFLRAWRDGEELHGWAIMKAAGRSGPTVYGTLDRLEDAQWIAGRWEDQHPEPGRPRRRFYRLTPLGELRSRELVASRIPASPRRADVPGFAQFLRLALGLVGGPR